MSTELPPDTFAEEACLPLEPLLNIWKGDRDNLGMEHITQVCGVGRRSFIRWREAGIPVHYAERIADELKIHPTSIWGSAYHIATYYEYRRRQERTRKKMVRLRAKAKEAKAQ